VRGAQQGDLGRRPAFQRSDLGARSRTLRLFLQPIRGLVRRPMASHSASCSCCSRGSGAAQQSLEELASERGLAGAALRGDATRLEQLLARRARPRRDLAGRLHPPHVRRTCGARGGLQGPSTGAHCANPSGAVAQSIVDKAREPQ